MSIYVGVGSAAKALSKLYVGVDGKARAVQKVYLGVDGKARLVYQLGTPLSAKAVGSTVKIKVNGTAKDFLIVQQGNPGTSIYDSSCAGTWLLMKDIYEERKWGDYQKSFSSSAADDNEYEKSEIHTYLNGTFYNLIDSSIRSMIKQVKIPYCTGSSTGNKTIVKGTSGLSTKVFLLSATEVKIKDTNAYNGEGAILSYFSGCAYNNADAGRVARLNGTQKDWYTRTPYNIYGSASPIHIRNNGGWDYDALGYSKGIRPAFILPSDTMVDENNNVIA